ncbi:alpha/beta hydrolase [Cellulomonas cellasea]|uniref:Pimeloyl-ACP methyl ester carboxylesterase n=1 Tax=Cellulomonas cellasea TaxID=43670 RepID=A0A7W4UIQ4_9CELL|nr:alpha/beta hydrolase [Cellulomonas cellasea]MBB2924913.1 pimeloyl-ACP methyl ester carboxylesterase [Cellulomonas cellasea]
MNRPRTSRLVSVLTALALVGTAAAGASAAQASARAPIGDVEAQRVDRVPTPTPRWFDCSPAFGEGNECTTVDLPLDYDQPKGPTTAVAVLRHPATDQANKIGSLFLNPGGPGGSGVGIAAQAALFLGPEVLERFDIIGMDPRGTNFSDNVRCWENMGEQAADLEGSDVPFPVTDDEEAAYVAAAERTGQACSTAGRPLSGSMSTAEVARDMDVLRRMVGDTQLTYLGFSYGSYLGNVYANMFPSRVRAVAIDGVLDPQGWQGSRATQNTPVTTRIKSGEGAAAALDEILLRCEKAGPEFCRLAGYGDPQDLYAEIKATLREEPLDLVDPETGEVYLTLTYPILVSFLLGDLYAPIGAEWVDMDLTFVWELLQEPAEPGTEAAEKQDAARHGLLEKYRAQQERAAAAGTTEAEQRAALGFAFPYDNSPEAFLSVLCTDSRNPVYARSWPEHADRADQRAPDFGRLWTWGSAPCAQQTWTVRDEDSYTGTFTKATANPVLVVGNYWDPATNYDGAVNAARLLPNSRLLSSDSWGHTAYGTSACATDAIDTYLLTRATPPAGTLCVGDDQPFTVPLEELEGPQSDARAAQPDRLPPVVPPFAGALPRD